MFGFKKQLLEESKRIDSLLKNINNLDATLARGTIRKRINKCGKTTYVLEQRRNKDGRTESMDWVPLGAADDPRTKAVALTKYNIALAKRLKKNQDLIKKCESEFAEYDWDSVVEDLGKNVQEILQATENGKYEEGREWMNEEYEQNGQDFLSSHITVTGEKVRSKNEVIIYNMLHAHNLCFRYESKLLLENEYGSEVALFPDFTIKGKDNQLIIWEHLGMMNMPKYQGNFAKRIGIYEKNNYHLWDNLFFTIDTKGEIDSHIIEKIIREFIIPRGLRRP